MNPVPPNAEAPKTWENPQRMTPATSRPVKVPTTEDRRAYRRPSETKLWTRFFRRIPSARATPISPFRSSASMTKMLMISRMPAMTVKNPRRTKTWLSWSMFRLAPSIESAFAFEMVKVGVCGRNGIISRTTSSE